ncbi:alpha/beta fold hydrolase [Nocardia australiensis]|uniref:alpha/beta fold hydrolase n=1 Tax=Nocardia australiensis TaxID=2887191 RepID=UPI001D144EBB|nr:alpha/beta fold hydrolase [Nocardia australiensis]
MNRAVPLMVTWMLASVATLGMNDGVASADSAVPPADAVASATKSIAPTTDPVLLPVPASTDSWAIGGGGVRLRVHEYGHSGDPTVMLVHGYMSTARAWDQVVARLATDYHVVTYDTRGNGESDHPPGQQDYALPVLAGDIAAVIDATAAGQQVHLVGWDWGAAEGWEAAATTEIATKLLDFTAVSGLNLDLWGRWIRRTVNDPADVPAVLDQAARSAYIALWDVPVVTDLLWDSGITGAMMDGFIQFEGAPPPHVPPVDGLASLNRYRANVFARLSAPTYNRLMVPDIHVIYGSRDPYIGAAVQTRAIEGTADHLAFTEIDSGHWSPITDPQQLTAAIVAGFGPEPGRNP